MTVLVPNSSDLSFEQYITELVESGYHSPREIPLRELPDFITMFLRDRCLTDSPLEYIPEDVIDEWAMLTLDILDSGELYELYNTIFKTNIIIFNETFEEIMHEKEQEHYWEMKAHNPLYKSEYESELNGLMCDSRSI